MKIIYIFFLICFVFLSKTSVADTAYQHFSIDELKLANSLIKAYKSGNVEEYKKYIESNRALRNALKICKSGLSKRLHWEDSIQCYKLVENKGRNKYGIGKMVYDYLNRTKTIVMFTKGFGSKSSSGGSQINGHWQAGELKTIGKDGEYADVDGKIKKYEKYKTREYNIIWLSSDLEKSPAAVAILLAHEVGHGLAEEYRSNYPLPYAADPKTALNKPPYSYFPINAKHDDEMWCYPFEGMMAEELGLTTLEKLHLVTSTNMRLTNEASRWYENIIGGKDIRFPRFYDRLRIKYCLSNKLAYLGNSQNRRCGMRCKFFKEYQYCDNPTKVPPCHLWKKHLESWVSD